MVDPETRRIVLGMMEDPSCEVELFRSMHQDSGDVHSQAPADFVPGHGKTVVLKINGGANNVRVDRIKTEDDEPEV